MKVSELIERLLECDLDSEVLTLKDRYIGGDYETDWDTPEIAVLNNRTVVIFHPFEKPIVEYEEKLQYRLNNRVF